MIRGMCEDYRAAAGIDLVHDRASRAAGRKVQCPMLVLWGAKGKIDEWYDALAIWRQYCAADGDGRPRRQRPLPGRGGAGGGDGPAAHVLRLAALPFGRHAAKADRL